jgi:membrane protein YqaA with SNARE-associated domain
LFPFLSLGYVGIFIFSFALNMLPFMSPSNILVAGVAAVAFPHANVLLIGFLVALASSIAKLIHYYAAFFAGNFLDDARKARLQTYSERIGDVGSMLLFVAAISSIPDDPIVIPLGLTRYNPVKFFVVFFVGKILVTTLGAYLGSQTSLALTDMIGSPVVIGGSIVLTIVVTYLLVKYDLGALVMKLWRRLAGQRSAI